MSELRMHFRKSLQVDASIADVLSNTWTPVRLLDISVGGAAIICRDELGAGSSRMLRFYLPGNPKQMHFLARVAHCNKHDFLGGYRIGLSFLRLNADDRVLLTQFIETSLGNQA